MTRTILLATVVVALAVAGAPELASAHNWGCWRQPDRTVRVRNTAYYSSNAAAAINEWNGDTILTLPVVGYHTEVSVFDGNYGNTGWGGLASIESASGCNILHGHATLNYYYSYTSNGRRGIFCQEVGHLFGLDHSNDGGCMGGGYFYNINTNYNVVSHNINDIYNKYINSPPSLGETDGVLEHEGRGPVHAFWHSHPRTLRQALGLSSAVVTARVEGVYANADIVVPVAGLPGDEHRVPNQRIALRVDKVLFGDAPKRIDLFHTGDEEFVLEGDPPYRIGEGYLLFLTPREDGTYRVISPEGRYRITGDRLEPMSEESFAAALGRVGVAGLELDLAEMAGNGR